VLWRNTALTPKIFVFDARVAYPFGLFLIHISLGTLVISVVAAVVFAVLLYYGITPVVAIRLLMGRLSGPIHMALRREQWYRRVDFRRGRGSHHVNVGE